MKSPSDTGNMVHESKMPEPFAWASSLSIERIKGMSGAWAKIVLRILPESGDVALYTAADLELAKQEATRQAMERCARVAEREHRNYVRSCESLGVGYADAPNGITIAAAIRALTHESEKRQ